MDLKLELSLKRDVDDLSSSNFHLAKDHAGPLFQSKETETMFILTAKIRGYMREQIKIDINKDGTVITIGGEKSIEEMIMVGWKVYKKGIEIRKFRKAFRIPDGVILDNINANFNEDEYMLTILMPKKVKGIVGILIEEIVEPEAVIQDSETLPATSKNIKKRVTFKEESIRNPKQKITERGQVNGIESADSQLGQADVADNKMSHNKDRQVVQEHSTNRGDDKTSEEKLGKQEMKQTNQETPKPDQICEKVESLGLKQQKVQDQEKVDQVNGKQVHHEKEKTEAQEGEQAKTEESKKKSKIFAPLVVGGFSNARISRRLCHSCHSNKKRACEKERLEQTFTHKM